jgi:hypothetical protein
LEALLLACVALHQGLRLGLMILFKCLCIRATGRVLRGAYVIGSLLLLEFLPLLFLAVTQVVLFLLIDLVAIGISRARHRLVGDRRQVCCMYRDGLCA